MAKSEYRGQDTILEKIKETVAEHEGFLSWNECCDVVAGMFRGEGLHISAEVALGHRK